MARDDDSSWLRPVLLGLGALVAVSLLVGGVVGAIALGAARLSGIGEVGPAVSVAPSVYIPSGRPTTSPQGYPDPPGATKTQKASPSPSAEASKKPKRKAPPITLQAVPARVSSGERIDLSGVYPRGEGATLQIQRFESGWTDFPVTARVSGGVYRTYIYTERTGKNRFRVLDKSAGRASQPVTVTVG